MKFKLIILITFLPFLLIAQSTKKQFLEAIKKTTAVIESDNKSDKAYYFRALAYMELKDYDKAESDLKKVIELNPDFARAYVDLADTYSLKREFKQAGNYYNLALENGYELTNRLALVIGSNFYFSKEYDLAIKYLLKAIDENGKIESSAYNNLAWSYLYSNKIDLAIKYFKKAYKVDPLLVNNVNNLGYAYYMKGDLDVAESYIMNAKKMDPKNSFVYRNLGLIYKKKENTKKACKFYKKAIDLGIVEKWGIHYIQELKDYCEKN